MKNLIRIFTCICGVLFLHGVTSIANAAPSTTVSVTGPASITVDPTVAVGAMLWSGVVTPYHGDRSMNFYVTYQGSGSYLGNKLYATEIAGIALRVKFANNGCSGAYWPATCKISSHNLIVELVKTGAITTGGSLAGALGSWAFNKSYSANLIWKAPVIINPGFPTCAVTTSSVAVDLGSNIPLKTFSGVGSVSPTRSFNLALRCSGGGAGAVTNVYTTLTDQTSPANVSDTLSLSANSTASGIGIQILNGATIVKYGPDSKAVGNMNQWKAGTTGNGVLSIPLAARYIQTRPVVTSGTANGRATFTMSYQ